MADQKERSATRSKLFLEPNEEQIKIVPSVMSLMHSIEDVFTGSQVLSLSLSASSRPRRLVCALRLPLANDLLILSVPLTLPDAHFVHDGH